MYENSITSPFGFYISAGLLRTGNAFGLSPTPPGLSEDEYEKTPSMVFFLPPNYFLLPQFLVFPFRTIPPDCSSDKQIRHKVDP